MFVTNLLGVISEPFIRETLPPQPPLRLRLWARFVRWLIEPIDFPGKWPNGAASPKSYNEEDGWDPSQLPRDR